MQHTEQGFNIGKPPYGYQVVVEKHPVPAKAALGKVKRRLISDPIRGPVVTQIYTWRVAEQPRRCSRRRRPTGSAPGLLRTWPGSWSWW